MNMNENQNGNQDAEAQAPASQPIAPVAEVKDEGMQRRTAEQFDKLLDSNKKLFEANELLRKEMSQRREQAQQFAPVQQNQPAAQQVNPNDFVETDPATGERYVNEVKLKAKIDEMEQKASRAEQVVQNYIKTAEEKEIERQNKEAFSAFPELNPEGDKFNKTFHQQVRGVLYDSMLNTEDYGGRALSFAEAAKFVRSNGPVETATTADKADATSTAGQALKEQGSAQVVSEPQNRPSFTADEDLRELQQRTRYGDTEALARRLLGTDHVIKDEE